MTSPCPSRALRSKTASQRGTASQVLLGSAPPSVLDTTRNRGTFSATRLNLHNTTTVLTKASALSCAQAWGSGGADFNFSLAGRDATGKPTVDRVTSGDNTNRQATLAGKYSQYAGEAQPSPPAPRIRRRTRNEQRRTVENGVDLLPGLEGQPFDARITRSAAYAQDEWEISPQWSAYAGVRHEQIKTISTGVGSDFQQHQQSPPLLHVNLKPDPKGRDLVRASLTRSYKAPMQQPSSPARPSTPTTTIILGPNTETELATASTLRLATGPDVAWEKYCQAAACRRWTGSTAASMA